MANVDQNELCLDKPLIKIENTSGKYHLAPCLAPTANLSLVDTCWTANGFIDDTALFNESSCHYLCIPEYAAKPPCL